SRFREFAQPLRSGIYASQPAIQADEHTDERLRHMAGAEDDNVPRIQIKHREEQLDTTAARHAYVSGQAPLNKMCLETRIRFSEQSLSFFNCFLFNFATADSAIIKTICGDQHLRAGILRRAADDVHQYHRNER